MWETCQALTHRCSNLPSSLLSDMRAAMQSFCEDCVVLAVRILWTLEMFQRQSQGAESLVKNVWLRVLSVNHWHKSVSVSLRQAKTATGCTVLKCGLGDLQSDVAQTFLIVVREGLARSPSWRDQLAVSAYAGAPGPRNPRSSCRFARLTLNPTGQSPRCGTRVYRDNGR